MKLNIHNRKHYILSFLYISTTIIFQFTLLQIGDSYLYQFQNHVTRGNRQDFKVIDISMSESNTLKTNFTQQFAEYQPTSLQTTCLVSNLKEKQLNLCSGDQEGLREIKDIEALEGTFPASANEIMIERSWNNHLPKQYTVQDTFHVDYMVGNQTKTKALTISGIYESKLSTAIPVFWGTNECIDSFGKVEFTNDFYFLSQATEIIPSYTAYFNITVTTYEDSMNFPKGNLQDLSEEELSTVRQLNKKFIENEPKMELYSANESLMNSGNVMKYLGFILLLPLILALVALQYLQTKLHVHEYRTLRCLGCTKGQLYLQVWRESLYSAIPALIAGILIGTILNSFIGVYVLGNLLHSSIEFEIVYTWKTYLLAFVLGLVPLMFSTTITMIKVRQKYPLQALLQKQKKQMKSYRDVLHFPPFSTIFIISIFSIMLFFYMISVNLLLILPKDNRPLKEQISSYEIMPNTIGVSIHKTVVNNLKKLKNVDTVYLADNGHMQMLSYEETFIPHYVYSPNLMNAFLEENDIPKDVENGILYVLPNVTEKKDTVHLQKEGSYPFQIETFESLTSNASITIDKVVTADLVHADGIGKMNADRAILLFSEKAAKELFGSVNYTNAFLDLSSDLPEEQVRMISTFLNDENFPHSGYEEESYDGQMNVVTMLLGYVTFIICFTAMLCFYCVLSCMLMTKQKEVGILRAIGLSRKRLFVSMSLEVSYMLICSAILVFIIFSILFSMLTNTAKASGVAFSEPSFFLYLGTLLLGMLACMGVFISMIDYQSKRQIMIEIKESEG